MPPIARVVSEIRLQIECLLWRQFHCSRHPNIHDSPLQEYYDRYLIENGGFGVAGAEQTTYGSWPSEFSPEGAGSPVPSSAWYVYQFSVLIRA